MPTSVCTLCLGVRFQCVLWVVLTKSLQPNLVHLAIGTPISIINIFEHYVIIYHPLKMIVFQWKKYFLRSFFLKKKSFIRCFLGKYYK